MRTAANLYINIGTEKSCLFCYLSKHLLNVLKQCPFLHYAVEESLGCAKNGYYAGGILVFSQVLNQFNERFPESRHKVAHEILKKRPTKEEYDQILNQLKGVAKDKFNNELNRENNNEKYYQEVRNLWKNYIKNREVQNL